MRILYSHRIQSRDGQSVHVEEMVAALRRAGHEVRVVGPAVYEKAGFGGNGRLVPLLRKALPLGVAEVIELAYNIPAYLRLRRAWQEFRPDIVYERYNLFFVAGALLARRHPIPFYVEVNSPLADERRKNGGLSLERLARFLERWVWRRADRIVAVTDVLRSMLIAQGAPASRIEVVANAINKDEFLSIRRREQGAGEVVLGFVGFVRPWHGIDLVLRAMAGDGAASGLRLIVAGDGPARPELEALARQLGIQSRVRFTGLVGRNEIPGLLAEFDIALQPAVVPYASPLKLFEYMAAGLPVVAPDQPNIQEILEDGRTALLYDPARNESMWQQIGRLAGDATLRERIGAAAREEILARGYTWDGNAARLIDWASGDLAKRERVARPGA